MFDNFTKDYQEASQWTWEQWQPYFDQLQAADLTADNIEQWLQELDLLSKMLWEIYNRLHVGTYINTNDEATAAAFQRHLEQISPHVEKAFAALNIQLVESGVAPDSIRVPLRNVETMIRLFNEDNLQLGAQENALSQAYNKIIGAQTVEWEGETIPLTRLNPVLTEPDRDRRKAAWLLQQERRKQDRDAHDALWRQFMDLRKQQATNAGFEDYRAYRWAVLNRHDYTPDDALTFVDAVLQVVVPMRERLHERRRAQLGYDTLRPWDLAVDPLDRAPLRPYRDIDDFIDKTEAIFHQVDPELGANFTTMKTGQLLDLENRAGKANTGMCSYFPFSERPFIFMNAVNVEGDVITLLHETGHAFHDFAFNDLDYRMQTWVPTEFGEVAAIAMELLAGPYLTHAHGGYFSKADAARFRANHLLEFTRRWLWAVNVAFQHWVYTNHEAASDPANCDAKWLELWTQYHRGVDWRGYEDFILDYWRASPLIFQSPFYMIEYGLAQVGALQIYANALQDQATALNRYREALALGGTVTLPELYEAAGAKLAFDAETLKDVVDLVESQIAHFDALQS